MVQFWFPKLWGLAPRAQLVGVNLESDAKRMQNAVRCNVYPGGPRPATLLQPLQTLAILKVQGATKVLQGATSRYNLRHFKASDLTTKPALHPAWRLKIVYCRTLQIRGRKEQWQKKGPESVF